MTNCQLKKCEDFSKNWINTLNSLKIQQKNYFSPQNSNLYAYAANNPVRYIDPDGKSPVYDTDGNLIGVTEDSGLQGKPFIMNSKDYSSKMTVDDAKKKDLGLGGLKDKNAVNNFILSYTNLSNRPDWDGQLTLAEANEWYKNGNGAELFVDINNIDLSMYVSLGDEYVGNNYTFNLQMDGSKDGKVFGNLTFKRYENDTCRAFADVYDFDYHKGLSSLPRNIATFFGSLYAGKGTPYTINIYGVKQLSKGY